MARIVFPGLLLIMLLPLAAHYVHGLSALPAALKLATGALVLASTSTSLYFLARQWFGSPRGRYLLCYAVVVLTAALGWADPHFTSVLGARIGYADGSTAEVRAMHLDVQSLPKSFFVLHPAFGPPKTPDTLAAAFAGRPSEVRVYLYKPPAAMRGVNGSLLPSDGISAEIQLFDHRGSLLEARAFDIPQSRFLDDPMIIEQFRVRSGVAAVKVHIGVGPPGSTADNDTTMVALAFADARSHLLDAGRGQFLGLLLCGLASTVWSFLASRRRWRAALPTTATLAVAGLGFFLASSLLALASAGRASFVYFWDYRNYWEKAETLFNLAHSGNWRQALASVLDSLPADYSMVPAVLPASVAMLAGQAGLHVFLLSIIALYALPAYVMASLLSIHLLSSSSTAKTSPLGELLMCLGALLASLPVYFGAILSLRPDVGGVAILCLIVLFVEFMAREMIEESEQRPVVSDELVLFALSTGLAVGVLFLFRRWYAFGIAGIAGAGAIVLLRDWFDSAHPMRVLCRVFAASALVLFMLLPFLASVLFDWSANFDRHDYATLYAAYKNPALTDVLASIQTFGLGGLGLIVVSSFAGFVFIPKAQRLWFILIASSIIAALLFERVQSPGLHHYYLLMPFFAASIGVATIAILRRRGAVCAIALVGAFGAGNAATTWIKDPPTTLRLIFPGYADWLPRRNPYLANLRRVAEFALTPSRAGKKVCVIASSLQINQDIFKELWQIDPALRKTLSPRIIDLGQVDSMSGAPVPAVRDCELMLVAAPFQAHLRVGEQVSVQILQEDLMSRSGIGAAYGEPADEVEIGDGIRMLVFDRQRQITDAEYADLVERYEQTKRSPTPH